MDRNAVLAKTVKGIEEVKSRTHGLSQKLRSILIMVDGQATVGSLIEKFGGTPEIGTSLDGLVNDGFVEIRSAGSATAAAPPSPAPLSPAQRMELTQPVATIPVDRAAAAPPAPPSPAQRMDLTQPVATMAAAPAEPPPSREQALSALTRLVSDQLGPDADLFTGALERARTRSDFVAAAERCAHAVAGVRGATVAQAFREHAAAFANAFLSD